MTQHNERQPKSLSDHFYPQHPTSDRSINIDPWWGLFAAVIALVLFMVIFVPDPYALIVDSIRDGIGITVITTIISFAMMLVLGLIVALGRLSESPVLRLLATIFTEIVRGIPLLVQLIFWYFAFPSIIRQFGGWLNFGPFQDYLANPLGMAILGLTVCYSAYMSEIYRAGIQGIPKGQMEAALSLGMTRFQAMRYVILPQAIRLILPPVGNEFISLLKDSSLVSVVAVTDMTRRGREFMSTHFIPVQTWTMIALIYLVMTLFSARIVAYIERRTQNER